MTTDPDAHLAFPDAPRVRLDGVIGELVGAAQEVLATQGRLRGLLHASRLVTNELELPTVLRQVVVAAVELVGARYGALGVIAPDGSLAEFIHVGMSPETVQAVGELPRGHGLLGSLIEDKHPIRLEHLRDDPRSSGFPPHHPPMDSFLGVPIWVRDEVFGNLYLSDHTGGAFTPKTRNCLSRSRRRQARPSTTRASSTRASGGSVGRSLPQRSPQRCSLTGRPIRGR